MGRTKNSALAILLGIILLIATMGAIGTAFGDDAKYIGSVNSEVYHYLNCSAAAKILDKNKVFFASAAKAVADGRRPCAICNPPLSDSTAPAASPATVPSTISVTINGVPVAVEPAPFVENGRTYVPVRSVLEAYGVDSIGWESPNVLITRGTIKLQIPVGQNCIIKNEVNIPTDAAAMIKDGRTCLPIRAVIEALGGTVGWDANTRTVLITKPTESGSDPIGKLNVNFIDVGQGDAVF